MPRPPLDAMSQPRLIAELRRLIDTARFSPRGSVTEVEAINELIRVVGENLTSSLRPHVLHNLGCRRRTWLRQLSATMPRGQMSDLLWQMGCHGRAAGRTADYAVGIARN